MRTLGCATLTLTAGLWAAPLTFTATTDVSLPYEAVVFSASGLSFVWDPIGGPNTFAACPNYDTQPCNVDFTLDMFPLRDSGSFFASYGGYTASNTTGEGGGTLHFTSGPFTVDPQQVLGGNYTITVPIDVSGTIQAMDWPANQFLNLDIQGQGTVTLHTDFLYADPQQHMLWFDSAHFDFAGTASDPPAVPEPATATLAAAALGLLLLARR